MLKVQILQIGETKDSNLRALEQEFEKRLKPYFKLETLTVKNLESKLDSDAFVIALDERGKHFTSEEFAAQIGTLKDRGTPIQFVIGDFAGLPPEIRDRAQLTLALSKMTFTHEMVRVFLKEQLYRACMILAGKPYHK